MADQDNQDPGQNTGLEAGQDRGHGADSHLPPGSSDATTGARGCGDSTAQEGHPEGSQPEGSQPEGSHPEDDHPQGEHPEGGTASDTGAAAAAAAVATPWYRSPAFLVTLFLLLALAATLGWLVWQKHAAEQLVKARHAQEQADLKLLNDEHEAYLNELRALLELDPCDLARALADIRPPAGRNLPVLPGDPRGTETETPAQTPAGPPTAQAGGAAGADGAAGLSSDEDARGKNAEANPNKAPADKAERGLEAREPANVAELLEQNTVLILAATDRGVSMGTGFFLSPDTIMTNAHVVGTATEAVYINKFVGSVRAARVLMRTRDNGLDFAVLRTNEPIPVKPLQLQKSTVRRMEKVSAWGFPAAVTGDDPKFMGLLRGNAEAAPEVVYTEGSVSVVLDKKPPVIVHTATVSQGNSGGPLVNERGEVVGINTMIKLDDKSYRQSSLAIPSSVMARFLEANKVPFTVAPEAAKDDAGANAGGGAGQ